MKRIFDMAVSLAGLIVLLPVMGLIALAVALTSPGGALFIQTRVGRYERTFSCCKFRTMQTGAPVAGTHEVPGSWMTPVGGWLRKTKLDELPQLWNVLKGEMSLVGPRPCLPVQLDVIAARRREGVFAIRPGITGLAQLRGVDMSTPDLLAANDRKYMERMSLGRDLSLIVRTFLPRTARVDKGGQH